MTLKTIAASIALTIAAGPVLADGYDPYRAHSVPYNDQAEIYYDYSHDTHGHVNGIFSGQLTEYNFTGQAYQPRVKVISRRLIGRAGWTDLNYPKTTVYDDPAYYAQINNRRVVPDPYYAPGYSDPHGAYYGH